MNKVKDFFRENGIFLLLCMSLLAFMGIYVVYYVLTRNTEELFVRMAVIFSIILMIASLAGVYLGIKRKLGLHIVYVALALGFGFVLMMIIPPFTVPDENAHFWTAYHWSNTMMGIEDDVEAGVLMRADDNSYPYKNTGNTIEDYDKIYRGLNDKVVSEELVLKNYQPLDTQPYQYFVSACSITVGRLLGLGTIQLLFFGRVINLLCFVFMVYLAIRIIPCGKDIVFFVGLTPMTLQLGASYSYDMFIISSSLLICALTLHLLKREVDRKYYWMLGVLLVLCILFAPVKGFAYWMLACIPIFLVTNKDTPKMIRIIVGAVMAIILIMFIFGKLLSVGANGDTSKYLEYCNEEAYSLGALLESPKLIFELIYTTLYTYGGWYIDSCIADSLGWLELTVPRLGLYLLYIALFLSMIKKENEVILLSNKSKVGLGAMCLFTIAFIFAGMLLGWTPVSSKAILGVQGRYFIPIILPLLLCFKGEGISSKLSTSYVSMVMIIVANYITIQSVIFRF